MYGTLCLTKFTKIIPYIQVFGKYIYRGYYSVLVVSSSKLTPFKLSPFKLIPFKLSPFKLTPFKLSPFKLTPLIPLSNSRIARDRK